MGSLKSAIDSIAFLQSTAKAFSSRLEFF